jgi:hypothetical protein
LLCRFTVPLPARAQNRGVYPLGMSALNPGSLPDSGLTYANQLLAYTRNRAKDNNGNTEPVSGVHAVVMDMNTFTWVSRRSVNDIHYAASATLPFAWNSLTSDVNGPINKGSGFGDSYYLPLILGRNGDRIDTRVQYGFLAPTGKFAAGANDNVGSGYWTHTLSSGQTLHLARDRQVTLSAFEMYEIHTWQQGTNIRPGDTFDLDASLMVKLPTAATAHVEIGAVGYAQRQTTARTGSGVPPASIGDRYAVHAAGVALSAAFPHHRANAAVKFFSEFANRSTFEGYSLQILAALAL